jgi:Flp pilus assembly protein TadG
MKINYAKKQRGAIVPAVVIAMPILLLVMGWALDFGHVFVNKTRLQNALDAAALSAAIAINYDVTKNTTAATNAGITTFNTFKAASGNNELAGLNGNSLIFEYSKNLQPFTPGSSPPAFVRVTSSGMLNVTPVLIQVTNVFTDDIQVPAAATAGPVGNNCSLTPFVMCAMMTPSVDTNCEDDTTKMDASGHAILGTDGLNDCYGYNVGQIRSLIVACNGANNNCPANSLESGNYNLLDLDGLQGGRDIMDVLCRQNGEPGYVNTCTAGNTLNTKPGYTWGNVRAGINCRFDSDTQRQEYYSPPAYTPYQTSGLGNNRRMMATPIADCTGLQNGNTTMPKLGTGCVFLTEHAIQQGSDKKIMAEFVGTCEQSGVWDPNNPVLNGPYKIILYKSPGSGDS